MKKNRNVCKSKKASKSRKASKSGMIMKGGKFLGEGSFGCVISPALSCITNRKSSDKYRRTLKSNNQNKTVSKIVLSPDNSVKDEIDIALKLKKLDPHQKHFITLNDYCKLKQVPADRSNIARVRYTDNSGTYFQKLEKKPLDKKYCPVDLSMQPINLIMPYGGYDLIEIAEIIEKYGLDKNKGQSLDDNKKHKLTTARMFFSNLQSCIKNLLLGLLKMHRNRIVNRDIKEENIMANYDETTSEVLVRFIDYGLSEYLTPEHCSHYSNINTNGTYVLIAPEIFITYNINKYNGNSDEYIMNKINISIQTYVKRMLRDLKLDTLELSTIVKTLYTEIKQMFKERTILPKYYGTPSDPLNGYLQKNDVYSLGITLYEFLVIFTDVIKIKDNLLLSDLLKNMIQLNPEKRFNVLQCLNHPYFTK